MPWTTATTLAGALAVLVAIVTTGSAQGQVPDTRSNNWLLETPDMDERFRRLQLYLRGFDKSMWEVGHRYEAMYDALADGNFDLARYQWDKIRVTIQAGHMKRPARRANAEQMFVQNTWPEVDGMLQRREAAVAWDAFLMARGACMACHEAERVGFMNDQPMFRRTERPPAR